MPYPARRSANRRRTVAPRAITGYGAYRSAAPAASTSTAVVDRRAQRRENFKKVASGIGKFAVRAGKMMPGPVGQIASLLGGITGLGSYKLRYNSIMQDLDPSAIVEPGYVPVVSNPGSHRTVRMRHREYVGEITSTTTFANTSYQINPANEGLFPWLSEIATNFQEYRFHGLVFEFISLSSDALTSTNTALGAVVFATNYNAGDANFANKQAAENTEFAVSCKPSSSLLAGVECDPAITVGGGHLYVSPNLDGSVPSGQDIKTYNLGNFQVITQGMQAANIDIGELWVSYDVELIKPIIPFSWAAGRVDHYTMSTVTVSPLNLLGATTTPKFTDFGTTISGNTITLPKFIEPGMVIKLDWFVYGGSGSSGATVIPSVNPSSTITTLTPPMAPTAKYYATDGTSATQLIFSAMYTVNSTYTGAVLATIVFNTASTNLPGGTVNGDLFITVMPNTFA